MRDTCAGTWATVMVDVFPVAIALPFTSVAPHAKVSAAGAGWVYKIVIDSAVLVFVSLNEQLAAPEVGLKPIRSLSVTAKPQFAGQVLFEIAIVSVLISACMWTAVASTARTTFGPPLVPEPFARSAVQWTEIGMVVGEETGDGGVSVGDVVGAVVGCVVGAVVGVLDGALDATGEATGDATGEAVGVEVGVLDGATATAPVTFASEEWNCGEQVPFATWPVRTNAGVTPEELVTC